MVKFIILLEMSRHPTRCEIWVDRRIFFCISVVFICPIAIAYSYGTDNKIGLRLSVCLCVCVSVCLSVCHHSHGRISLQIYQI